MGERYDKTKPEIGRLEPAPGRIPPSALDAEAAVLSACLLDAAAVDVTRDILQPQHFYADANRRICEAIYATQDAGQPADIVTVAGWLRDKGRLDQIGGTPYLALLSDATPSVAHAEAHAEVIREKWRLRCMISVCQQAAADGYGDVGEASEWMNRVEQSVFNVAESDTAEEHAGDLSTLIPAAIDLVTARRDGGSKLAGTDTGWDDLNELLSGWIDGKLYVLAGRPGMGKTGLGLGACLNVAKRKKGSIFISAEMSKIELAIRLLSLEARVSIERVMAGVYNVEESVRLRAAANRLRVLPMVISERPGGTLAQIRSDVRRKTADLRSNFGAGFPIGLVAVDYIQVLNGERHKGDSRENEVSGISRGLMHFAGETKIPVLALSQLNRDLEKRPDKRPQLSDLRESGSLEQDAYSVIFVYRDEYYNKESQDKGIVEVIVEKHRNGRTGTARMSFEREFVAFDTIDTRPTEVRETSDWGNQFDGTNPYAGRGNDPGDDYER